MCFMMQKEIFSPLFSQLAFLLYPGFTGVGHFLMLVNKTIWLHIILLKTPMARSLDDASGSRSRERKNDLYIHIMNQTDQWEDGIHIWDSGTLYHIGISGKCMVVYLSHNCRMAPYSMPMTFSTSHTMNSLPTYIKAIFWYNHCGF